MSLEIPNQVQFRVNARTIQMLGRENIPSPVMAVLELVKNAYDADANEVKITFRRASTNNGYIEIEDDGLGMNWSDIYDKWLVIGTSNKKREPVTPRNRVKIGEKGIGRLAINLLGKRTIIETHRTNQNGLRLEIDWTKYDDDQHDVHEIQHSLQELESSSTSSSGTKLSIDYLTEPWYQYYYTELHDHLTLLVPPLRQDSLNFKIILDCDEAPDISGEISSKLDEATEYILESTLSTEGEIRHKLTYRDEILLNETRFWDRTFAHVMLGETPICGPIRSLLHVYLHDTQSLKMMGIKQVELDRFLTRFRGVHIYQDNFRVEMSNKSWLNWTNLQKNNLKLEERYIVGTVFITREHNPDLQDQANRQGLKTNLAFQDLKRFMEHCIFVLAREKQRHQEQTSTMTQPISVEQLQLDILTQQNNHEILQHKIEQLVDKIEKTPTLFAEEPQIQAQKIQLVQEISQQVTQLVMQKREVEQLVLDYLQEERQLLFGLSTLGIVMATFGHETKRHINHVFNATELLKDTVQQLPDTIKPMAENDLMNIENAAHQIAGWASLGLDHIRRHKRTQQKIELNKIIEYIFNIFSTEMTQRGIQIDLQCGVDIPRFRAFQMDIESILINFLTNAVDALNPIAIEKRQILVRTQFESPHKVILEFADSGRGILPQDEGRVFDPLFTTKVDENGKFIGTGLGLTIVKNLVEKYYRGTITAQGQAELGGAKFTVTFPVKGD